MYWYQCIKLFNVIYEWCELYCIAEYQNNPYDVEKLLKVINLFL